MARGGGATFKALRFQRPIWSRTSILTASDLKLDQHLDDVHIEKTETAEEDLNRLHPEVRDTFESKIEAIEKNLGIGATPDQAFNKRMSGDMHPILQMTLGGDYRAWFLEGSRLNLDWADNDTIYCIMVLTKKEQEKLTRRIADPVSFAENRIQE